VNNTGGSVAITTEPSPARLTIRPCSVMIRKASRTVWRLAEKRAINPVSVGNSSPTG